ncbi:flavin reductase family protein [Bordetella petrii]|uniref:flavin reductase family protein n=1 Tax=Bordetella petrii TaxID=94624 RepID=UPI001E49B1B2|nr:flavin reductase family protein [Bordetella petrii]MCD0501995.1 flavin reductase family protein [Bordetella petrii]
MTQIRCADLNPEQTYRLMTGVVVPRPIAWVTTQGHEGVVNLAPFSCFTFVSNKPPMVGINMGRKAGVRKDTARNIHAAREFVVNIGDETMIDAIHQSAVEYPADTSEPELLGLALQPSAMVVPPRLQAAPISMECRLHSIIPFGDTGAEFFVGEVLVVHVRDGLLRDGKIDTAMLRPVARLAGPNYAGLGPIVTKAAIAQTPKTILTSKAE